MADKITTAEAVPKYSSVMEVIHPSQIVTPEMVRAMVRADPAVPPPEEDPITVTAVNRGRLAKRYLYHGGRNDEQVALWIPDGARPLRGVLTHLHRASEAYRTDLQAFARAERFAVFAMLSQWVNFHEFLPDQLAKLGAALGHPEVAGLPWAAIGGSRNVAAMCCFAMLDPHPDRLLCILANGGPGIAVDLGNPGAVARFRDLPVCVVNGSHDPYVEGNAWLMRYYPAIRAAGLPWTAAVDWGGGHSGQTNNAVYWPFIRGVMALRGAVAANPLREKPHLQDFTQAHGLLVGPMDWENPGEEPAVPAPYFTGDRTQAVWLPDADTLAVWRAYVARNPQGTISVDAGRDGVTRLSANDLPADRTGPICFYTGSRLLGETTGADLDSTAVSEGVQVIHAAFPTTDGHLRRLRPVTIVDGDLVDQRAGIAAALETEQPVNILRLEDAQRQCLARLLASEVVDAAARAVLHTALKRLLVHRHKEQSDAAHATLDRFWPDSTVGGTIETTRHSSTAFPKSATADQEKE